MKNRLYADIQKPGVKRPPVLNWQTGRFYAICSWMIRSSTSCWEALSQILSQGIRIINNPSCLPTSQSQTLSYPVPWTVLISYENQWNPFYLSQMRVWRQRISSCLSGVRASVYPGLCWYRGPLAGSGPCGGIFRKVLGKRLSGVHAPWTCLIPARLIWHYLTFLKILSYKNKKRRLWMVFKDIVWIHSWSDNGVVTVLFSEESVRRWSVCHWPPPAPLVLTVVEAAGIQAGMILVSYWCSSLKFPGIFCFDSYYI